MKHTLADSNQLHYELHGNPNASQTLVFLGGLSQTTLAWAGYLPSLQNDYRIVLLDLIFQGQSDNPDQYRSFKEHAEDVNHLITEGLAIQQYNLIGISYGGAVAMRVMRHFPERIRKSVLMSTFAHKTPFFDAIGSSWASALQTGGYNLMVEVMLPYVLGKHYFEHPLIPLEVIKQMRYANSMAADRLIKLMTATGMSEDFRPSLQDVQIPTLVIQGEEDILCTPDMGRSIAHSLPKGEFMIVPEAGHTLNLEAIPQTLQLIKGFIED